MDDDQDYVARVYHTAREFYATGSRKFLGACLEIGAQKTCILKAQAEDMCKETNS